MYNNGEKTILTSDIYWSQVLQLRSGPLQFTFRPDIKWKKYTFNWLLYVLAIVITGIITFFNLHNSDSIKLVVAIILQVLLVVFGIFRVIYYFNLPEKVYVRLEDHSIFIYKPNLQKKQIELTNIIRVVEMKDMILLILESGKEEQIHKAWLTDEDILLLKKELNSIS